MNIMVTGRRSRVLLLAGSLALLVSAALAEMADRGSYILWSKEQFFSPYNSSSAAEVEKMAMTGSSSSVVIDLADDVSRFFRWYATTQRFRNASSLYPSECLMDFLSLFSSEGDSCKGYKVLDASGRPGPFVLGGNFHITGSFDECLNIEGDLTQYCILPLLPLVNNTPIKFDKNIVTFLTEVCLPQSCNTADVEFFVTELNMYYITTSISDKYSIFYVANSTICQDSKREPFNAGAIAMLVVCLLFLVFSLVGTAVDVGINIFQSLMENPEFLQRFSQTESDSSDSGEEDTPLPTQSMTTLPSTKHINKKIDIFASFEKPLEFITAFSIIKNLGMIISTKQPPSAITCLNGIRVISISWIILGHLVFLEHVYKVLLNENYTVKHYTSQFSYQEIINYSFPVDSFFFMSGVLAAYLNLTEMQKKEGRFPMLTYYLHRYLRLTTVYAFVLFFCWTLIVHMGNGPLWRASFGEDSALQKSCQKYWWTNLLYINNLYPWEIKDECLGWTWYLANDMQFFVLAPIIIIPLYFFFPLGLIIAGILLVATFVANGTISAVEEVDASLIQVGVFIKPSKIYIKPYTRAAPYIVGLVMGYVLFKKFKIKIHWFVDWLIYQATFLTAACCLFACVYGLYSSFDRGGLSLAESVSYFMFSRFTWGVGLALLVFTFHNGYASAINAFLSMGFWVPLGRLTYTTYLIHPIFLFVFIGTLREPFTYTNISLAVNYAAMVVFCFGAAGVVALFVEFPLYNLEMAIFEAVGLKVRTTTRNVASHVKDMALQDAKQKSSPVKTLD